jgi:hypothetical protein
LKKHPKTHFSRSPAADAPYVWGLSCVYLLAAAAMLPQSEWPRALGGAVLIFGGLHVEGSVRRGKRMLTMASLFLAFGIALVLVIPTFPAMGGRGGTSTVLGFIGVQLALLVRGVARWVPSDQSEEQIAFAQAITVAMFVAVGISLIASIPIGLALLSGSKEVMQILWVYPAYFIGAFAVAVTVWSLQGLRQYATGRYLIGVIGASCVYGAVMPVVAATRDRPESLGRSVLLVLVLGGLLGPAFAFDRQAFDAT